MSSDDIDKFSKANLLESNAIFLSSVVSSRIISAIEKNKHNKDLTLHEFLESLDLGLDANIFDVCLESVQYKIVEMFSLVVVPETSDEFNAQQIKTKIRDAHKDWNLADKGYDDKTFGFLLLKLRNSLSHARYSTRGNKVLFFDKDGFSIEFTFDEFEGFVVRLKALIHLNFCYQYAKFNSSLRSYEEVVGNHITSPLAGPDN